MRVRELLGLAAQGLTVPDDPDDTAAVDAVMRRADRLRRRRRIAVATCSAVAVVAVGVGTALLPQPGLGAPKGRIAASEPPAPAPVPSRAAAEDPPKRTTAPATTGPPPSTPADEPSAPPPTETRPAGSASPSATEPSTPTKSPTARTTSGPPTAKSTRTAGPSATASAKATDRTARAPEQVIAGHLPPDAGTVSKDTRLSAASPSHPLDGTYLVIKNGRTGILQIAVRDPEINPEQPYRTVEDELTYDRCAPDGNAPANTDCRTLTRPDGSVLKTWTRPGNQPDPESPLVYGKGCAASVTYPDGRAVVITSLAGITGSDAYGTPMDAPPLSAASVAEVAGDTAWFAS